MERRRWRDRQTDTGRQSTEATDISVKRPCWKWTLQLQPPQSLLSKDQLSRQALPEVLTHRSISKTKQKSKAVVCFAKDGITRTNIYLEDVE